MAFICGRWVRELEYFLLCSLQSLSIKKLNRCNFLEMLVKLLAKHLKADELLYFCELHIHNTLLLDLILKFSHATKDFL